MICLANGSGRGEGNGVFRQHVPVDIAPPFHHYSAPSAVRFVATAQDALPEA
jgi:hypothetical protein